MNRVTITIEALHGTTQHRHITEADYDGPDYSLVEVLAVLEDALRGAGYSVPLGSLIVEAQP